MQGSTFISKLIFLVLVVSLAFLAPRARGDPPSNKVDVPEEQDFSSTPFTDYGEFHQAEEEEADTQFLQNGRFFGVSLGLGFQFLDGNRGTLWQGGFPLVDFKVHYWFDFNLGLDMGFFTVNQFYDTSQTLGGHVDVNLLRVGLDVKYYLTTQNLSAPISFANPYVLLGFGSFTKTENSFVQGTQDRDTSIGLSLGAGLEFVVTPRKIYFEIEGKMHLVQFKDTNTTTFQSVNIPNLNGNFYSVTGNVLFTW